MQLKAAKHRTVKSTTLFDSSHYALSFFPLNQEQMVQCGCLCVCVSVCVCVCDCACINPRLRVLQVHLIHLSRRDEPPQNLLTDLPRGGRDKSRPPKVPSADFHSAQSTSESNSSFSKCLPVSCLRVLTSGEYQTGGVLQHVRRKFSQRRRQKLSEKSPSSSNSTRREKQALEVTEKRFQGDVRRQL